MHYANGREAKAGDVVRGKGYNIKHEIVGLLVYANPGTSACNCQVVTVTHNDNVESMTKPNGEVSLQLKPGSTLTYLVHSGWAVVEYGQLDAFVALDPATGEVLPPEAEVPTMMGAPTEEAE